MSARISRFLSSLSAVTMTGIVLVSPRADSDPAECPFGCCFLTLTIPGIPGESTVVPDAIDVQSFSWAVHSPVREHGERGQVQVNDFSITTTIDKASPTLFRKSVSREHLPSATVEGRRTRTQEQPYLRFMMEDVLVTSFSPGGSCDGGVPTEDVTFNFGRITYRYQQQGADGGVGQTVSTCWDFRTGRECM